METKKLLHSLLNNAYAMETAVEETLKSHVDDAKDFPELQLELQNHLEVTTDQKEKVRESIEKIGGNVSESKEMFSDIMGKIQGLMSKMMPDKVLRNIIMESATEAMEIASYKQIILLAEKSDEQEVVEICTGILRQEEEMAKKIDSMIPKLMNQYVSQ